MPKLRCSELRVNSECFAQKLRIQSKTPNFGGTKNSGSFDPAVICEDAASLLPQGWPLAEVFVLCGFLMIYLVEEVRNNLV